ncbi:MAG: hypothetical protein GY777_09545, partial [Candidatus Brocadiaceae bacterium]|nr:hypothetical protein [Candidatus Brocadiaceae bacterium]
NSVKIYGDVNPPFAIEYSGFVNGDDASDIDTDPVAQTSAVDNTPVGSETVTLTGGDDNNYTLNLLLGSLGINRRNIVAKILNDSLIYGDVPPSLNIEYSSFIAGDDVSSIAVAPVITCAATSSSDVGTYNATLSGGDGGNYILNYTSGAMKIKKRELTATAADTFRIYGDVNPLFRVKYSGFVNGDDESDLNTQPVATTLADLLSDCNTYDITMNGGSDDNYNIVVGVGDLTVNKRPLTAKAINSVKIYGDVNPPFAIEYSGFVNGDDASVIDTDPVAQTSAVDNTPVGSETVTLTGGDDNNYTLNLLLG